MKRSEEKWREVMTCDVSPVAMFFIKWRFPPFVGEYRLLINTKQGANYWHTKSTPWTTRMLNMISKTINVKCCSSHLYHQPPYVWRDSNISQHFRARTCRSQALEIIDCKWLGNKRLKVKVDFLSFVLNKPPPVAENKLPNNNSNWFDMSTTPTKDHEDLQLHL